MNSTVVSAPARFPDDAADRCFRNFVRSRITALSLFAILLYAQLAVWLPAGWLAEVMRCCQATLSFMVLAGYWRRATVCFFVTGRWPETHNVVALGIWISWFSIFFNAMWSILYRLAAQPSWMINNDYYTAWTMASSFAACLHVFAPNLIGQDLPKLDKIRFSAAGAMGLMLLIVVGFWRPDLSDVADWLHRYMAEPEWMLDGLWRTLNSPSRVLNYLGF